VIAMRLFLDITRIATRVIGSAPTGVDRVEYAYATEILQGRDDLNPVGVITTPLFSGALRAPVVRDILARVGQAWKLDRQPSEDPVYQELKAYLERPLDFARPRSFRVRGPKLTLRLYKQAIFPLYALARAPARLKRWAANNSHGASFYLNSSHTQLEKLKRFAWTSAAGARCVFFIHDIIPIAFPEYVSPGSCARHEGRMNTVARLGSAIIVNSDYTARSVARYFEARQAPAPEIKVIPLGVADRFLRRDKLDPPRAATPYFVVVSTIEPRKNMLFLFAVWRRLAELLGPKTPRLVVVGRRGWENENIIDAFERSKSLGPYLVEAADLSDAGLASLLRGAVAMAAPSSVEGFGLPVVEALSLGVPVIASDIAAHREAGGRHAAFIDPIDGAEWVRALLAFVEPGSEARSMAVAQAEAYQATPLSEHVARAAEFVHGLAGR
jgi:glycosyltransferase involved in cell wall biosynthesis